MDIRAKLRPLYLGKILYERTDEEHYLTTNQLINILADEYGIPSYRATIATDIEMLIGLGMNISIIKSTQNRYKITNRKFNLAELKLLIDAVQSAKFIPKDKSEQLTEKLSSLSSIYQTEKLVKRESIVEGQVKSNNARLYAIVDIINDAINKKRQVSFVYSVYEVAKKSIRRKPGEQHIFSPFYLVWNGDFYYIVGWSHKHHNISQFRIDRIETIPVIMDKKAHSIPHGFRLNRYINTMFHMFSSERKKVELLCTNDVANAIVDRFGDYIPIEKYDEERFRVSVNVAINHIFYSWVFGFEGKVQIVKPVEVVEGYKKMVFEAVESM